MQLSIYMKRAFYPLASQLSSPVHGKLPKRVTADEAVSTIASGDHIFVHGPASTPTELLEALCRRVDSHGIKDLRPIHIILGGKVPWTDEKYFGKVRSNGLFLCGNVRKLVKQGQADYTPVFLSDMPTYFYNKTFPVDVALISVSPPDDRGFCTFGPNLDTSKAAVEMARKVIALVNPKIPVTHGNTLLHQSRIDYFVECDRELYGPPEETKLSEEEIKIGKLIAENLVDNGATLQLGIGAIPDSTLVAMKNHKDLGIHTELLGGGVMDLVRTGVINNTKKSVMPGKIVTTFAFGTQKFYRFLDNNPMLHFDCCSWTNHSDIIRANSKMTCINSGIEIDITGQVAADSIGSTFYSGFGGQTDFMGASSTSYDGLGKAIMAISSRTAKGQSKIVTTLSEGAGVTTTRGHTRYVVTEYGIAYLGGKTVRQRAHELIKIAHPDDRERLEREAFERLKCMPSP
uniref:Acetyl-CoA hydrolase n=1 Tax=Haemonchus contortus TaxID=6289 RepID=A0A7I4Y1P8_HAECO